jgi:S1/P1 Nuclease
VRRLAKIGATALLCAISSVAAAWDFSSHMAIGIATYDYLRRVNPALISAVIRLAESLPQREKMDAALAQAASEDRERLIFAYLSRWSDDIRGTSLDRPAQHAQLRVISAVWLPKIMVGDARLGYEQYIAVLKDPSRTAVEKASALAWVFHIVEDMQNPLHAATWFSMSYLRTDDSGTLCYVRQTANGEADSLHNFWDAAADYPGDELASAARTASDLEAINRTSLPELNAPATEFRTWQVESAALARSAVYLDGRLARSSDLKEAPVLPTDYMSTARTLARRRMAIASYRLADILKQVVPT